MQKINNYERKYCKYAYYSNVTHSEGALVRYVQVYTMLQVIYLLKPRAFQVHHFVLTLLSFTWIHPAITESTSAVLPFLTPFVQGVDKTACASLSQWMLLAFNSNEMTCFIFTVICTDSVYYYIPLSAFRV